MRASTMFFLIIAILLGLTGIVVAKSMGLFDKKEPAPTAPVAEKTYRVLAAYNNIYNGQVVKFSFVRVKTIKQEDYDKLIAAGRDLLPGNVNAINRRVAARNIQAEHIMRERDLLPVAEGEQSLDKLLIPGARAVRVDVLRANSASCMFKLGDYVDVQLNAVASDTTTGGTVNHSAIIARNVKVLGAQGSLMPISQQLRTDCPCNYILEANPYRAALIDYAKNKGQIALLPASGLEEELLDKEREKWRKTYADILASGKDPGPFIVLDVPSIRTSEEFFKTEPPRVVSYYNNEFGVGDKDLARLFHLKEPVYTPPTATIHIIGNRIIGTQQFPPTPK